MDERFASVLTDPRFQLQEKDKYGRKQKKKKQQQQQDAAKEELKSFYVVKEDNDNDSDAADERRRDDDDNNDREKKTKNRKDDDEKHDTQSESESSENDEKVEDPASRIAYLTALSRGELDVSSSSDDDDSSQSSSDDEDGEDGEDPVYGSAGILDPSTQQEETVDISYDPSPFLVVTNMDWENVKAVDIFAILSSFAPPGGVSKVQVYQSDFGMERMEKDKLYGPTGIWKKKKNQKKNSTTYEKQQDLDDDQDDDDDQESAESDNESKSDLDDNAIGIKIEEEDIADETDFDPEKLRAYEASKLKYYFAVVEFSDPRHADVIYQEVDGLEFEHSSAAIDLRTLPPEEVDNVVSGRPLRDEATSVPGNYDPPDFIVSALQQTNVQCTWDQGDAEREKKLTKYGNTGWRDDFEDDDLKAYLASDASSDEDSEDEDNKAAKGSKMRKLLGLDSDGEEAASDDGTGSGSDSEEDNGGREIRLIPGKKDLEEKIRSKLASGKEEPAELTPWQKYQEKRKQKRKELRRAARGLKTQDEYDSDSGGRKRESKKGDKKDSDDFFEQSGSEGEESDNNFDASNQIQEDERKISSQEKAREELELLLAGEHDEEKARDYDIRGIQRMEKNKGKKLKGSRKRKEEKVASDVSGTDFKVDVNDDRFKAVLDGGDDRFGIDKTDPNYKDTSAMRKILSEQTKRRKKKRQKTHPSGKVAPDVNAESNIQSASGTGALSSLVQRLKTRVESHQGNQ